VPGGTVVLDGLDRPWEREVLARWEAQTPWRFRVDEAAGVAVGARGKPGPAEGLTVQTAPKRSDSARATS
jgi:hypothetical protein